MKVWILKKNKNYSNHNNYYNSIEVLKKIYFIVNGRELDEKKITYGENGKPYHMDFYFNISHSKNYIAIAISNEEVGIDIEERDRKIYKEFANKILKEKEKIINSTPLNNWVIKEAYSKFIGLGLKLNFREINANVILNENLVYNISSNDFICYVISKEKLEQENDFDVMDDVVRCYYDNIG